MATMKILVINPNSSLKITAHLDRLVKDFVCQTTITAQIETYTAPSGPPSIDNDEDAIMSSKAVMADLQFRLKEYNAYLVACYSLHPLVGMLKARVSPQTYVTGIFESSISTSLSLLSLGSESKFGIISTGEYWQKALSEGVSKYCGSEEQKNRRFKGVETIGMSAGDLLNSEPETVRIEVKKATKRLVRDRDVQVICLGCSSMAQLHDAVNEALDEELGDQASSVYIVDGIKAGIGLLDSFIKVFPARCSSNPSVQSI